MNLFMVGDKVFKVTDIGRPDVLEVVKVTGERDFFGRIKNKSGKEWSSCSNSNSYSFSIQASNTTAKM